MMASPPKVLKAESQGIVLQPQYHGATPISKMRAGKFLQW
jgi:hypothetical protein